MLTPVPGATTTSSLTAQNVIDAVRDLINEESTNFWSNTEMLKWVNDGIIDIVSKTWCLSTTENITLVTNTLEYTLANNIMSVVGVLYNAAKGLTLGHPMMLGHIPDVDEPVYYYVWNQKIGIIPKPSITVTTKTCAVYEVIKPTEIAAGGLVTLPSYLDDTLQLYMMKKCLLKDSRPDEAKGANEEYLGNLQFYRADLLDRKMQNSEKRQAED